MKAHSLNLNDGTCYYLKELSHATFLIKIVSWYSYAFRFSYNIYICVKTEYK